MVPQQLRLEESLFAKVTLEILLHPTMATGMSPQIGRVLVRFVALFALEWSDVGVPALFVTLQQMGRFEGFAAQRTLMVAYIAVRQHMFL